MRKLDETEDQISGANMEEQNPAPHNQARKEINTNSINTPRSKQNYIKQFIKGDNVGAGKLERIVRICGIALFALGLATLYSLVYLYKDTGVVPFYALIIAAIELTAGFTHIKFAYMSNYKSQLLAISSGCAGGMGLILALCPAVRLWPAAGACAALVVSVFCQIINIYQYKK